MKTYEIGETTYTLLTIGELAKMCGKSVITLRKYEEKGILPEANIRDNEIETKNNKTIAGQRLYTIELAKKVSKIFRESFNAGIKTDPDKILEITRHFKEELTIINNG